MEQNVGEHDNEEERGTIFGSRRRWSCELGEMVDRKRDECSKLAYRWVKSAKGNGAGGRSSDDSRSSAEA